MATLEEVMEEVTKKRKAIIEAGRARRAMLRERERFTWTADELLWDESSSSSKGKSRSTTG